MTNLKTIMNGDVLEIKTESQLAVGYIDDLLSRFTDCGNATEFYATTIVQAITSLSTKEEKTARDWEALLKWTKELEGILQVKSKVGYRYTPQEGVEFEDDISG